MEVTKESSLVVRDISVEALSPNSKNVNEMDAETFERLVIEIREVGFISPVQVVPSVEANKFVILGGEHRWKAAKQLGMTHIPCTILSDAKWSDQDLFDLVTFRLNSLHGKVNPEKFIPMYEKMAAKFGHDALPEIFAVTDKSLWKKMTKGIVKDAQAAGLPPEMTEQLQEAQEKAKDVEQFTKAMNNIFKKHSETVSHGAILFVSGKNENIVIHATDKVFELMKVLTTMCSAKQKNINELLEPSLVQIIGTGPETSVSANPV